MVNRIFNFFNSLKKSKNQNDVNITPTLALNQSYTNQLLLLEYDKINMLPPTYDECIANDNIIKFKTQQNTSDTQSDPDYTPSENSDSLSY